MKKILNKFLYGFFKGELEKAEERDIITQKQLDEILEHYEESTGFNYVWVLGTVGALLVGLGFLLVVANNWDALADLGKLAILIGAFSAALGGSHALRDKTEYTSRALLYTSALIFGSGVFLVVNAYDLSIEASTQMYLWTLATLLLSAYRKDMILFLFAHILTLIFIGTGFDQLLFFHAIPLIALLYLGNHYFNYKTIITYFTLIISLQFIFYTLDYMNLDPFFIAWIIFAVGLAMKYVKHDFNRKAFQVLGIITVGVSGFALSFADVWANSGLFSEGRASSIIFSIALAAYMLYLLTKKEIIPLIIVGALIMRYYFDTLYDFLPRALFFVLGGLIILAIGVFIERLSDKK